MASEQAPTQITYNPVYKVTYEGSDPTRGYVYVLETARPTPVAPVTPDATGKCGELVTVEKQYRLHGLWTHYRGMVSDENAPVRYLVDRSQAVELLAAEIRRERDLAAKQLSEVVDRMSDDYLALKAELDQAVGVIEDRSSEYEALEAKLTAAEKALKSARPYVEDYDTRRHNTGVDETLTQIDAALGGKPL